jgi:SAM-dependent methyltransferase
MIETERIKKEDSMPLSLEEIQEMQIQFQWQEEKFIEGLDSFLKNNRIHNVLDCSGGIGFPVIGLKQMSWDVSYSDGSAKMFDIFQSKIRDKGLEIPSYLCDWSKLTSKIHRQFDCVLCRGNSLVYIDSWGENQISDTTLNKIRDALRQFWSLLNEDGILYVDIYNEPGKDVEIVKKDLGVREYKGKIIELKWHTVYDMERKNRTWNIAYSSENEEGSLSFSSYLLSHAELISLLYEVGFKKVEQVEISGENVFTVYIAKK